MLQQHREQSFKVQRSYGGGAVGNFLNKKGVSKKSNTKQERKRRKQGKLYLHSRKSCEHFLRRNRLAELRKQTRCGFSNDVIIVLQTRGSGRRFRIRNLLGLPALLGRLGTGCDGWDALLSVVLRLCFFRLCFRLCFRLYFRLCFGLGFRLRLSLRLRLGARSHLVGCRPPRDGEQRGKENRDKMNATKT